MPDQQPRQDTLSRRYLVRGGALLAATTAAGVLGSGRPAAAADGQGLLLGRDQDASRTTSLTLDGDPGAATLELRHDDGPALRLHPLAADWDGDLAPGDVVGTTAGPLVGVVAEDGPTTTYLATGTDLDAVPRPQAVPPVRIVDTRNAKGLANLLRSSPRAFTGAGRLRAGAWVDVAVDSADADFTLHAAYLNVTARDSSSGGHLTVYSPGGRPGTSTLNFRRDTTTANGCLTLLDTVGSRFAFRLSTSATTHFFVDLTGVVLDNLPGPASAHAAAARVRRERARTGRPRSFGRAVR